MRKGIRVLFGIALFVSVTFAFGVYVGRLTAPTTKISVASAQSAQGNPSAPSGIMAASAEAVNSILPVEITVGGRPYEVLPILRGNEESVRGDVMISRAKEMKAHLGQEDGEYLLAHQGDIPVALQGKVVFVFTDWPHPGNPGFIACVFWNGDRWVRLWVWLDDDWYGRSRVLRRHSTRE